MQTIIFATGNEGKMREIRDIMAGFPARFLSMKEAGIEADIVEDRMSFIIRECDMVKADIALQRCDGRLSVFADAVRNEVVKPARTIYG